MFSLDNASTYLVFETDSSGTDNIGLYTSDGSFADVVTTFDFTVGTWYDVGFTKSGTSASVYLAATNGGAWSVTSGTVRNAPTANKLWFFNNGFVEWWNGCGAGLKLWDGVALTADEMQAERMQLAPVRLTNLWGFWPGYVHTELDDVSGGGRTLTAGGTLATEEGPPVPLYLRRKRTRRPEAASAPPPSVNRRRRMIICGASA